MLEVVAEYIKSVLTLFEGLKRELGIRKEVVGKGRSVGGREKGLIGRAKREWEEDEVNNIYESMINYNPLYNHWLHQGFEDDAILLLLLLLLFSIHYLCIFF